MLPRRWTCRILYDMLTVGHGPKTTMMYAARLNSRQLQDYLGVLVRARLVKLDSSAENGLPIYSLTDRGQHVLKRLREINDILVNCGPDGNADDA